MAATSQTLAPAPTQMAAQPRPPKRKKETPTKRATALSQSAVASATCSAVMYRRITLPVLRATGRRSPPAGLLHDRSPSAHEIRPVSSTPASRRPCCRRAAPACHWEWQRPAAGPAAPPRAPPGPLPLGVAGFRSCECGRSRPRARSAVIPQAGGLRCHWEWQRPADRPAAPQAPRRPAPRQAPATGSGRISPLRAWSVAGSGPFRQRAEPVRVRRNAPWHQRPAAVRPPPAVRPGRHPEPAQGMGHFL